MKNQGTEEHRDISVCRYHLKNDTCQLSCPFNTRCEGEANCGLHQLNAGMLCPNCGKKGADWSGYGHPSGFKYTCWHCEHVWTEPFAARPKTPGVCLRCGGKFDSPVPAVTNPKGTTAEIACAEWCSRCNALTMGIIYRESSMYKVAGTIKSR